MASDDLQCTHLLVETVGKHVTPMVNIHVLDSSLATASSCGSDGTHYLMNDSNGRTLLTSTVHICRHVHFL